MLIGVDFDNTIVCYDALFHKVARQGNHIPPDVPANKSAVRNYLRRVAREEIWTEMQGHVYGARMGEATPYPCALEFFQACHAARIPVRIISHKTREPYSGKPCDLHAAALAWLEEKGFFERSGIGLKREDVFLELTKEAKLRRISQCGCTHFIDDLPEFLADPTFPHDVQRVLFDSNNLYAEERRFIRIQTWNQAGELFALDVKCGPKTDDLREKIRPFVHQQGIDGEFDLQRLPGGANNRVYRLCSEHAERVLKFYFHDSDDLRDRFRGEQAFYTFLWNNGIRRTPEPFGWDADHRVGMFSFVAGRKLRPDEVNDTMIGQALAFIIDANTTKPTAATSAIPMASEACFSIGEHLDCVRRRVARLEQMDRHTELDEQGARFVRDELTPAWNTICARITTRAGRHLDTPLPSSAWCLSASDFGFHNALLCTDLSLRFFDFEYAGWDDPAKLVCDFFCQPEIRVGLQHWNAFVGAMEAAGCFESSFVERARLLLPAYQIKWCCIILNDFVRCDQARRVFAVGLDSSPPRKAAQLIKARAALACLEMGGGS